MALEVESGKEFRRNPAAAFVFIGLDPNPQFPQETTVAREDIGFITADGMFQASVRGVFAAGDLREGSTKQLGSAVGDGMAALLAVRWYLQEPHHLAENP